jgi:uncharacterized damage-inducible protein DinB
MVNAKVGEHCNTIAAVYAHVISAEDYFANTVLQGKPRLWDSGGWARQLGIASQLGRDWSVQIPDLDAFQAYAKAVHEATDALLTTLTPEELDRKVQVFGNERPAANVLMVLVNHAAAHAGEIAALKGIQGVQGLSF